MLKQAMTGYAKPNFRVARHPTTISRKPSERAPSLKVAGVQHRRVPCTPFHKRAIVSFLHRLPLDIPRTEVQSLSGFPGFFLTAVLPMVFLNVFSVPRAITCR